MSNEIEVRMVQAKNGRYAIIARRRARWPWIQIESVAGHDNAREVVDNYKLCDELLTDAEVDINPDPMSQEGVDEVNFSWGEDSPVEFPAT